MTGGAPPRHPGPDTQPDGDDHEHTNHRLRAGISNPFRNLSAKEVRQPDIQSDEADTSDERSQHKYGEPHPEDPGHKCRHRHGCQEGVTAEGTVAFGEQFQAPFLEASWVFEQPASLADINLTLEDLGGR